MNASTFSKAIDELVIAGLIDLELSKRTGADIRQPNIYAFSYRWKQIPLGMAISRRCPKNRIMGRDKTGIFSPRLRTMAVGL